MSGSVNAFNQYPDQLEKLRANPDLIDNAVAEIIRWQTPLSHMRRTALEDVEVSGYKIRKGDKVVMWYLAGNRDETVFTNSNQLDIERGNARQHLAFGFGIHRCLGMRLAEMQLKILWTEIFKRWQRIEIVGPIVRVPSNFVNGYTSIPVKLVA
jgi:cytochrome P450